MFSLNNNEIAVPCWDRLLPPFIGNSTRCVVVGQYRDASCVILACVPLEHELSNQTNSATADGGGAERSVNGASSHTSRSRRRRRHAPTGYLSIRQVAERADAALSTAYAWIESDRIQAARWRGRLIVSEEAVDAFLAIKPRKHVVTNTATAEANND